MSDPVESVLGRRPGSDSVDVAPPPANVSRVSVDNPRFVAVGTVLHILPYLYDAAKHPDTVSLVCCSADGVSVLVHVENLPRLIRVPRRTAEPEGCIRMRNSPRASVSADDSRVTEGIEKVHFSPYVNQPTPPPGFESRSAPIAIRARVCLGIGYSTVLHVHRSVLSRLHGRVTELTVPFGQTYHVFMPVGSVEDRLEPDLPHACRPGFTGRASPRDTIVKSVLDSWRMSFDVASAFARIADVPLCTLPSSVVSLNEHDMTTNKGAPMLIMRALLSLAYERRVAEFIPVYKHHVGGGEFAPAQVNMLNTHTLTYCMDFASMYPSLIASRRVCVAGMGILPRVASDLIALRQRYTGQDEPEPGSSCVSPLRMRTFAKLIANVMYGVCSVQDERRGFVWVNRAAMAAMTAAGRAVMVEAMTIVHAHGGMVLGGITDSLFFTSRSDAETAGIATLLRTHMFDQHSLTFRVVGTYRSFLMCNASGWIGTESAPSTKVVIHNMHGLTSRASTPVRDVYEVVAMLMSGKVVEARAMVTAMGPRASGCLRALVARPFLHRMQLPCNPVFR